MWHLSDMQKKRKKIKLGYSFIPLPLEILGCEKYCSLSPYSVKLLFDMLSQFKYGKNGDLCASWSVMSKKGWVSRDTLNNALKDLLAKGFIEKTRQGYRRVCSLYAVTWLPIDLCDGKLDVPETKVASKKWKAK
jgi:hypothetical protein